MKCPHCKDTTLMMTERQGVEIDYCPACRGIWLDRGELDKLLERAGQQQSPSPMATAARPQAPHDLGDSRYRNDKYPQRKYTKSWLHEIFD